MPIGINRLTVIALLGSALYLLLNLFTFSGVPFLLDGDQVYFWTYGIRMLHGERIYQDFFTMHPPGTALFYSSLFSLFGERLWVTNLAVLAIGVALCWVCFHIASQIMEAYLALLATGLFLVLVYGKMLNGTHHWFSLLAVMGAIAAILPAQNLWRILLAGSLLGVASFFTQTRGPFGLLGIVAFIAWNLSRENARWPDLLTRLALLCLSFVAALTLLSSYFIARTGVGTLWYFQITYVRQHLVATQSLGLPETLSWQRLPFAMQYLFVYLLLPFAYATSLYKCWRLPAMKNRRAIALLALVGIALLAEVAFSLNWLRVFAVSMPGLVLLIWLVDEIKVARRIVIAGTCAVLICLGLAQTWSKHARPSVVLELPAGRVAVRFPVSEKLDWLAQHTKTNELFFQAGWTSFYLPLRLRNPVFLDALECTALTSPEYVELAIRQLETRPVRYVLWPPRLNAPDPFYGPGNYHVGPFRNFLQSHYHIVRTFPDDDEIWERNSPLS